MERISNRAGQLRPTPPLFQLDTVAAAVEFEDGGQVVVVCPSGGNRHTILDWTGKVVETARGLHTAKALGQAPTVGVLKWDEDNQYGNPEDAHL